MGILFITLYFVLIAFVYAVQERVNPPKDVYEVAAQTLKSILWPITLVWAVVWAMTKAFSYILNSIIPKK